ncbi:MAG: MlaE family lipid ABC transporter permease subunit [Rhodospirillaceae bacterium]|nr:MlaE family lipid ABC transporter permease subunit [Rhodospirillaceae bacterium]MBT6117213.1 MlaE family lipid ABC transporter permease subunit [Rhodospirillaceae bacterium]
MTARGRWEIETVARFDAALRELDPGPCRKARLDLAKVEALDSTGAWAIHRTREALRARGLAVEILGAKAAHSALIERVAAAHPSEEPAPPPHGGFRALVERVGASTIWMVDEAKSVVAFLGLVTIAIGRSALRPKRIRMTSVVANMERSGLNALPIVGLLSFLIGVVLAYQGVDQLTRFGAEIFSINLLAVSMLREIGVLMTAILIAGRSGSAFTAQIGTMKVNQEIDAMSTLGLDPIEVLVLPRIFALVITLPLLAFYADMVGMLGGGIALMLLLDMSPAQFLIQLNAAIPLWTFWVGIIKAPFFAFAIALIGCYEGLRVSGSAESVGRLTTQSVVEAIFLVLVLDASFSILFSSIGI